MANDTLQRLRDKAQNLSADLIAIAEALEQSDTSDSAAALAGGFHSAAAALWNGAVDSKRAESGLISPRNGGAV